MLPRIVGIVVVAVVWGRVGLLLYPHDHSRMLVVRGCHPVLEAVGVHAGVIVGHAHGAERGEWTVVLARFSRTVVAPGLRMEPVAVVRGGCGGCWRMGDKVNNVAAWVVGGGGGGWRWVRSEVRAVVLLLLVGREEEVVMWGDAVRKLLVVVEGVVVAIVG